MYVPIGSEAAERRQYTITGDEGQRTSHSVSIDVRSRAIRNVFTRFNILCNHESSEIVVDWDSLDLDDTRVLEDQSERFVDGNEGVRRMSLSTRDCELVSLASPARTVRWTDHQMTDLAIRQFEESEQSVRESNRRDRENALEHSLAVLVLLRASSSVA